MALLRSLVSVAITTLSAVCTIGGSVAYHLINQKAKEKPNTFSSLFATLTVDSNTGTNTPELYAGDSKSYTCLLTSPAKSTDTGTTTKQTEKDPWCQIYSIEDKDESSMQLKNLAHQESQDPKVPAEIKTKDQIKANDNQKAGFYQISIDKDILDKFKNPNYSDLEIKLVPNSTTSNEGGQYITFQSYFRFDKAETSKQDKGVPVQGTIRSVVVQIMSEKHTCGSTHKDFTLDSQKGYHFFNLSQSGTTEVKKPADIKSKHTTKLWMKTTDQVECSKLEKNKFYILKSPLDNKFDLKDIYTKELELTCDYCSQKIKVKIWRILAPRQKISKKSS